MAESDAKADYESEEYAAELEERFLRESMPRCLDDGQLAKVREMHAGVAALPDLAELQARDHDLSDTVMARYLVGRKWSVDEALQRWHDTMAWRRDNGVNSVLDSPPAAVIKAARPFHLEVHDGHDRLGRAIWYWRCGAIDPEGLRRAVSVDQFMRYHLHVMEEGSALTRASLGERYGKGTVWREDSTVVADARGMTMGIRGFLAFLDAASRIDELHYPDTMGEIMLINAPAVFRFIWPIAKPLLDPQTAAKVRIIGADYQDELRKLIAPDQLLEEFGGTRKCPPEFELEAGRAAALEAAAELASRELTEAVVPSKGTFSFDVAVAAGDVAGGRPAVVDYRISTHSHDIELEARFEPAGGGDHTVLIPSARRDTHKTPLWGELEVAEAGRVVFNFDNSYSWFTSKTVLYQARLKREEPEPAA